MRLASRSKDVVQCPVMKLKFFTTGGTIDKVYFDAKSEYEVGPPQVLEVLKEANVTIEFEVESLLRKDSLDLTDDDRRLLKQRIEADSASRIIVTHGTDTMLETAKVLLSVSNKTIVLTGSMQPARFRHTDAEFNIGCAVGAVQALPAGVYVVMNGRVWDPAKTRKNRDKNCFETIP
jgi:L-asparaginase